MSCRRRRRGRATRRSSVLSIPRTPVRVELLPCLNFHRIRLSACAYRFREPRGRCVKLTAYVPTHRAAQHSRKHVQGRHGTTLVPPSLRGSLRRPASVNFQMLRSVTCALHVTSRANATLSAILPNAFRLLTRMPVLSQRGGEGERGLERKFCRICAWALFHQLAAD